MALPKTDTDEIQKKQRGLTVHPLVALTYTLILSIDSENIRLNMNAENRRARTTHSRHVPTHDEHPSTERQTCHDVSREVIALH